MQEYECRYRRMEMSLARRRRKIEDKSARRDDTSVRGCRYLITHFLRLWRNRLRAKLSYQILTRASMAVLRLGSRQGESGDFPATGSSTGQ